MTLARPMTLAGLCLGAGLCSASADGLGIDPGAMPVITDTPEYCWHLAREVAAAQQMARGAPPRVRVLASEGQHMCDAGMVRGGIRRLRSALMLLRNEQ
jgi:hypothetical protein